MTTTTTNRDVSGAPRTPNGSALAAVLAAGIGAFALGAFVIANEAGLYAAPALYGPAGGLSGRAVFATVVWLVAWGILHTRWRQREIGVGQVVTWTLVLVALSIIATFPPVWSLL
jgi:hypothetical protein